MMQPTCAHEKDCEDARCWTHNSGALELERLHMERAKKQLKRWCPKHRCSYYGADCCPICLDRQILSQLVKLVKLLSPRVKS